VTTAEGATEEAAAPEAIPKPTRLEPLLREGSLPGASSTSVTSAGFSSATTSSSATVSRQSAPSEPGGAGQLDGTISGNVSAAAAGGAGTDLRNRSASRSASGVKSAGLVPTGSARTAPPEQARSEELGQNRLGQNRLVRTGWSEQALPNRLAENRLWFRGRVRRSCRHSLDCDRVRRRQPAISRISSSTCALSEPGPSSLVTERNAAARLRSGRRALPCCWSRSNQMMLHVEHQDLAQRQALPGHQADPTGRNVHYIAGIPRPGSWGEEYAPRTLR